MRVMEARRTRTLIVRLDRGEALPGALLRALAEADAKAGWITGAGELEAAEIAVFDQNARANDRARRIDSPCELLSLTGSLAELEGSPSLRLSVTLAREADSGLEVLAGQLLWANVFAVELCVHVFDDVPLVRVLDDRTGLSLLSANMPAESPALLAAPPEAARPTAAISPPAAPLMTELQPSMHATLPHAPDTSPGEREDFDVYPEPGDQVNHFHFGECTVVSSNGERLRLRQGRDGRVREVSLTMLRITSPEAGEDGSRHFRLERKPIAPR